jgi:hypothetical protein
MDKGKFNLAELRCFTSFISVFLTFFLLDTAGVEHLPSFSEFSFSAFILWIIFFHSFEKLTYKISVFTISIFSNKVAISS